MSTKEKILFKINQNPGITISELCFFFNLTKPNVSIHLKNLESKNFIIKYPFPNHLNFFKIHPTNQGKKFYLNKKLEFLEKLKNKKNH